MMSSVPQQDKASRTDLDPSPNPNPNPNPDPDPSPTQASRSDLDRSPRLAESLLFIDCTKAAAASF